MSTNRVLAFLQHDCPHCVATRRYDRLKERCEAIEAAALGTIDFCVPSIRRLAGEREDFDEEDGALECGDPPTMQIFIALEGERAPIDSDLRAYAVREMRRIAGELAAAADAVESAVTP